MCQQLDEQRADSVLLLQNARSDCCWTALPQLQAASLTRVQTCSSTCTRRTSAAQLRALPLAASARPAPAAVKCNKPTARLQMSHRAGTPVEQHMQVQGHWHQDQSELVGLAQRGVLRLLLLLICTMLCTG